MSFPRDEFGNTNYGPPPSNFEEAATLIPSICMIYIFYVIFE